MGGRKKWYDKEFKMAAVRLALPTNKPINELAEESIASCGVRATGGAILDMYRSASPSVTGFSAQRLRTTLVYQLRNHVPRDQFEKLS